MIARKTRCANSNRAPAAWMDIAPVEAMRSKSLVDFVVSGNRPSIESQIRKRLNRDCGAFTDLAKLPPRRSTPPPDVAFRLYAEAVSDEDNRWSAHSSGKTQQPGRQGLVGGWRQMHRHLRADNPRNVNVGTNYRRFKAQHGVSRRAQ
jgi:hypothetical protein